MFIMLYNVSDQLVEHSCSASGMTWDLNKVAIVLTAFHIWEWNSARFVQKLSSRNFAVSPQIYKIDSIG